MVSIECQAASLKYKSVQEGVACHDEQDKQKDAILKRLNQTICQLQGTCVGDKEGNQLEHIPNLIVLLEKVLLHGIKERRNLRKFLEQLTHPEILLTIREFCFKSSAELWGKIWICQCLSDNLLESYIWNFIDKSSLVEKNYCAHALLLDKLKLNLLLSITSGLENITLMFDTLQVVKYLDNCKKGSLSTAVNSIQTALVTTTMPKREPSVPHPLDDRIIRISQIDIDPQSLSDDIAFSLNSHRPKKRPLGKRSSRVMRESVDECEDALAEFNLKNSTTDSSLDMSCDSVDLKTSCSDSGTYASTLGLRTVLGQSPELNAFLIKAEIRQAMQEKGSLHEELRECDANNRTSPDYYDQMSPERGRTRSIYADSHIAKRTSPEGQEAAHLVPLEYTVVNGLKKNKVKKCDNGLILEENRKFQMSLAEEIRCNESDVEKQDGRETKIDNNILLQLMIDIFEDHEERIYKFHKVLVNHTTGCAALVLFVLTNKQFYVIDTISSEINSNKSSDSIQLDVNNPIVVDYEHVDFVQIGLGYHSINIVCKTPKRRYWLCTANEELTKSIICNLEMVFRRHRTAKMIPNIFEDTTACDILLRKWISSQFKYQFDEVEIRYYGLVFCASLQKCTVDGSTHNANKELAKPSKTGELDYSFTNGRTWSRATFSLRNGILGRQSVTGCDWKLSLRLPSECQGCRKINAAKNPYAFQIVMTSDTSLQLAAKTEVERCDWFNAILESVNRSDLDNQITTSSSTTSTPVSSCCMVVTSSDIIQYYQDLELNTFTVANWARVQDIDVVSVKFGACIPFCVLEFEYVDVAANERASQWVVYFNSQSEMNKFIDVISSIWENNYKVGLDIIDLDPASLLYEQSLSTSKTLPWSIC